MEFSQIDGLVQERCDSSALALQLRLSFTNPSKSCHTVWLVLYMCSIPGAPFNNMV